MELRWLVFLVWLRIRAGFCQSECWQGGFTQEFCCNETYPAGNPVCWDDIIYTFKKCCRFAPPKTTLMAKQAKTLPDTSCWIGVFTEEACCSRAISPRGNPACWSGEYTYERCCPSDFVYSEVTMATPAKQQTDSTCWNGVFTEEACCSHAVSPRGDPACWIGEYTYERCCPTEFIDSELTSKSQEAFNNIETPAKQQTDSTCWNGVFTEEACCSHAVSPRGDPACWIGEYTYERCCPSEFIDSEVTNKSHNTFNDIATPAESLTDWSCWTGVFTEEACCSSTVSSGGNPACWFGGYTYERCCPIDFANKSHTEHVLHEDPEVSQAKADCWKGNHNLEMGCCNPFEDKTLTAALCWKDGRNYYDCCKRDYNVVASLTTLLKQPVLEVVPLNATLLELPLQRPAICQNTGGFTDLQVCQHLQQAEHMLRHGDPGCWSGFLTRDYCCDPPLGNPQCWNLDFTYETCCMGVNPEVAILHEFYGCEKCVSMVQQPRFSCKDFDVWRRQGTILAMSKGSYDLFGDVSVDVLCLPKMADTRESVTAAIFALQWIKDHHRSLGPSLDLLSRGATILEVALMLLPWLAFRVYRAIRGQSDQPVVKVDQSQRIAAIDGARLIVTVVVVLVHVNIVAPINDPDLEARRLMWHYALRFTDIFGVLSVLVTSKHSESLLGSADALWRKLGRQLPLSFIMVRLRMWTAGLCQHFESCEDVANSGWSLELLVRCLTFSQLWHLSIDIKIWLVFRAIYWLNQHLPAPVVLLGVVLTCIIVVHQNTFHENLYYQFWAYRLPMSLLVYAFQRTQLQRWAPRHPWLWCSTAAVLCSLGWVGCIPQPANPMVPWQMQGRCTETGWAFFWGGVFFHLGVAMLCLFWPPRLSMPAFNWMADRLSPLAFGILTLHFQFFRVLNRCEHSVSPWFFFAAPDTEIQFRDDSPRFLHLALWTGGIVLCILAAQVVYWMVQQPWENYWFQCPKPVSRLLVFAYLLLFLCKESNSRGDIWHSRLAWFAS